MMQLVRPGGSEKLLRLSTQGFSSALHHPTVCLLTPQWHPTYSKEKGSKASSVCVVCVSKVAGWMEEKIRPDMIVTLHTVSMCLSVCVCVCVWWWSLEPELHKDGRISTRLSEMAGWRGPDMKPCEAARAFADVDLTVHSSFFSD